MGAITWPLRGKRFGAWLRQQYYERTSDAPSPAALNAALNVLEAQAQFDGEAAQLVIVDELNSGVFECNVRKRDSAVRAALDPFQKADCDRLSNRVARG